MGTDKLNVKCVFCNCSYELEKYKIDKKNKYMQCPFCGKIGYNPLFENE